MMSPRSCAAAVIAALMLPIVPSVVPETRATTQTPATGFTDPEIASLQSVSFAVGRMTTDLTPAVVPLVNASTAAQRAALQAALVNHQKALRALLDGTNLLLNVNVTSSSFHPDFSDDPAPSTLLPLDPSTREHWIRRAWVKHDRAIEFIGYTMGAIVAIPCRPATPCASQRDLWLRGLTDARMAIQAVDRRLAYATPLVPSAPHIVGPHGDYEGAQWYMWRGGHYALDALDTLVSVLDSRTLTDADGANLGRAWLSLFGVVHLLNTQQMTLAGVLQTTRNPFFRTLDVLEALQSTQTGGLAVRWAFWLQFDYDVWDSKRGRGDAAYDKAVALARQRTADAWQKTDMAAWKHNVFLDCSLLRNREGCGGR